MSALFRFWHRLTCRDAIERRTHREFGSPHYFEALLCRGCGATLKL